MRRPLGVIIVDDMTRSVVLCLAAMTLSAACSAPEGATPSIATPTPSAPPRATASPSPTPSPTPSASSAPTGARAGTYLALGDSLAVGVGATQPHQTGYVGRVHQALSAADATPRVSALTNLAVSGETSTSMIRDGQLAEALDVIAGGSTVALMTLDIGGNDLLRLLATDACAAEPLAADCLELLALTLADFETNYRQILEELTDGLAGHARGARLAVMTYFNPFSGTDTAHESAAELALLGTDGRLDCDADDPRARGMNDIIACVAGQLGAVTADVKPAFDGLGLELTHIGSQDIHANDRGYEAIGESFLTAIDAARRAAP
jgi:acyl-CoA thioesterase I